MRSARPSASAVLPTPGSPTSSGLFLRRRHSTWIMRSSSSCAADQRIDRALGRLGHQVGGIRFERIRRRRAGLAAIRRAPVAAPRRAAVRDRAQQRQPIDALLAQEVRGVALFLLQQEHQQRAALDLLRARRCGVDDRALDDAIEAERRFGLDRLAAGHRREGAFEHFLEIALRSVSRLTRHARQDVARLRILDQRVQHVLEADEVVTAIGGDAKRAADALERVGGERNRCAAHVAGSLWIRLDRDEQRKFVLLGHLLRGLDLGLGDVAREQARRRRRRLGGRAS